MKRMIKRMQDAEIPLRSRLFQLLSAIALAEFLFVTVYTVVTGGDLPHILVMFAGTALFAVTVSFTFRSGKMRVGSAISALLYYAIYPLTFFSSGGLYGGAPVVFAFALVYVFLATQHWERTVCLAACVLGSAVCYLTSYLHPELLERHTYGAEHAESILSVFLVTLLLCTLFAFVTAVYRAENRIVQKQKKEIEELNAAQKRFFSSMSHEIRTPVNAIIGLNEMTLREEISDEVRENSQNIEVAGKTLLHTVNEILDLSKLETGGMEIRCENYRTTAMFSEIVGMVRLRAQEKGLEFRIEADPRLPSVLCGDEVRIKQILLNLVTNAVKYTKKGSVTLTLASRADESGAFRMVYEVTDTGVGIREEDIPELFTVFRRADEENTHRVEGTGLGLSIVKQLLELMDGDITVESEYGRGSSFRVEIPQTVVDPTPIGTVDLRKTEKQKTAEAAVFTAPDAKILAVDDTPMNLMVVKKLLRRCGAAVDTAESGREALEKTGTTRYDVIFMDHQMPEMDGIECLRRIREQENGKCRDSKVVCLTANVGEETKRRFLEAGFDAYLAKPVRGKEIEQTLQALMTSQE